MKKRIAAALIAAMMAGTVITGCGTDAKTEAPAVQSTVAAAEQAPEAEEAKEERHILGRYVSGIDNRAVLEGAKSIDYLIKAKSMKNVVTRIDVDDSAVDTAKPGTIARLCASAARQPFPPSLRMTCRTPVPSSASAMASGSLWPVMAAASARFGKK